MLQFLYADGYNDKEDKLELTKVEDLPIDVSDISNDRDLSRLAFVGIRVKYNK